MKKRRGRPSTVDNIRVLPIFREKPDIEKLGRAVIAMAEELAGQKEAEGEHENSKSA